MAAPATVTTTANVEQYIDTTKPVLVTGGTGYLAGVLIKELLQYGLSVHTTVRDVSDQRRYQYLQDVADQSANNKKGTIKFFEADLLDVGSFKEAMDGCSVVFHTASPFTFDFTDPQTELIDPAVRGTENVLQQANETPSVTRVVLTSSSLAIHGDACDAANGGMLTEDDWNRSASLSYQQYALSKTYAEQKAWVIAGGQTQWKLVVMNPCLMVGPGLKYSSTSESYQFIKKLGSNDPTMAVGCPNLGFNALDVRDAAIAHVRGGFLPNVSGRYILNNSPEGYTMQQMGQLLGEEYTSKGYPIVTKAAPLPKIVFWVLGPYIKKGLTRKWIWNNIDHVPSLDNAKSAQQLGMTYRPMKNTLCEMYQVLINEGVVTSSLQK